MTAAHAVPTTKRRRWRAFLADRNGATAVEFALIGPAFIALLLAIIQTFLVFFAQQLLEQVVNQSSRAILTGQAQAASMTQAQFATAVCSNVVILFASDGLSIASKFTRETPVREVRTLKKCPRLKSRHHDLDSEPLRPESICQVRPLKR